MSDAISSVVEAAIAAGTIPGAALIVARQGKTTYEKTWGTCCTRTERGVPVALSHRHLFFSYSKLVTAVSSIPVWPPPMSLGVLVFYYMGQVRTDRAFA